MFKKIFILLILCLISQNFNASNPQERKETKEERKVFHETTPEGVESKKLEFNFNAPNLKEGILKLTYFKKNQATPNEVIFPITGNSKIDTSINTDQADYLQIEVNTPIKRYKNAAYGMDVETMPKHQKFLVEFSKFYKGQLEVKPIYDTLVSESPYRTDILD